MQSLDQYLNRRYLAIIILLVSVFTFLISYMHWSGMDDTTEYYMLYEAEVLTQHYQANEKILEFDAGYKEYYWGTASLPQAYRQLLKSRPGKPNRANLYLVDEQSVYILPYDLHAGELVFYVVHLFDADSYAINNQAFQNLVITISLAGLVLVILLILFWNRNITRQISAFDAWVKKITRLSGDDMPRQGLPEQVAFKELVDTAASLNSSLKKQHQLQEKERQLVKREKEFLSSLSHELRTPIAVISAAIALLGRRGELSPKDSKIVQKLSKANTNMKLLTNTLLQVWRKQESKQSEQEVCLAELVELALEDSRVYCEQSVNFGLEVESREKITLDITLAQIVINNLLRNACQYSSESDISVVVDGQLVTIANSYDHQVLDSQLSEQYGFGFGLYLVETICQQQGWHFSLDAKNNSFSVRVGFDKRK